MNGLRDIAAGEGAGSDRGVGGEDMGVRAGDGAGSREAVGGGHSSRARNAWQRCAEVSIGLNLFLGVALVAAVHWVATDYVVLARTGDGRSIEAQGLKEPVRTDVALRNWVVTAVSQTFTLGHSDWRERLGTIREYFSDSGHDAFVRRFTGSRYLKVLRDEFQKASAVAQGAPVIVGVDWLEDGRPGLIIEFPMLITFEAGENEVRRRYVARVAVGRVPLGERQAGIGIEWVRAAREREA